MSFHKSSVSYVLEDDHILKAVLRTDDDEEQESVLDLNGIIGNDDGHFSWGGVNFQDSASSIELNIEGDDEVPVLRATLISMEGEEIDADINLAERISNDNGNLVFLSETE
ncbi:hypothetical protein N7493_008482 [Penicillium malachiteum]|uniref:Cyanovirin-N domain-containing protein n=1 Tax=Penicillium malachiteum TaxID=1324776 RepID=A0AAD6HHB2_9EURO|nr:hypothetical protein N7493_008482 [Penicillium malachiteum]